METNTTDKLIDIVKRKDILFHRGEQVLFKKYSYFQVINAYKNLFVCDDETIMDIKNNININNKNKIKYYRNSFKIKNDVTDNDLYENICNKICLKYGIKAKTLSEKETLIDEIHYHHHMYIPNISYGDFLRMYKFEHELRMMLFKYILIIEESVKNIFISYLNDKKVDVNYLVNMNNYNTLPLKSKSFDTIKLIISKYDNQKSKPIKRKRDQHLDVPYWMLINELAMNQTYYAISNLNERDSYQIFLKCANFFTKLNISETDKGKSSEKIIADKKMVNNFKMILYYLGEFRNMLAHNQPIYCYNIKNYNIKANPSLEYELPTTRKGYKNKKGQILSHAQQQLNLNGSMMQSLSKYFGPDSFNANNSTKLDLSKIIYILDKILKQIDPNTKFYEELQSIFIKYNIVLTKTSYTINDVKDYLELTKQINKLNDFDMEIKDILDRIGKKRSYIRKLKSKEIELRKLVKEINQATKNIKINETKSKYKVFPAIKKYSEFTGIDMAFFHDIK